LELCPETSWAKCSGQAKAKHRGQNALDHAIEFGAGDIAGLNGGGQRRAAKSTGESLRRQQIDVGIEVSALKEDAALIGSARLFQHQFWRRVKPLLAKT
jgi:hypothetical protein